MNNKFAIIGSNGVQHLIRRYLSQLNQKCDSGTYNEFEEKDIVDIINNQQLFDQLSAILVQQFDEIVYDRSDITIEQADQLIKHIIDQFNIDNNVNITYDIISFESDPSSNLIVGRCQLGIDFSMEYCDPKHHETSFNLKSLINDTIIEYTNDIRSGVLTYINEQLDNGKIPTEDDIINILKGFEYANDTGDSISIDASVVIVDPDYMNNGSISVKFTVNAIDSIGNRLSHEAEDIICDISNSEIAIDYLNNISDDVRRVTTTYVNSQISGGTVPNSQDINNFINNYVSGNYQGSPVVVDIPKSTTVNPDPVTKGTANYTISISMTTNSGEIISDIFEITNVIDNTSIRQQFMSDVESGLSSAIVLSDSSTQATVESQCSVYKNSLEQKYGSATKQSFVYSISEYSKTNSTYDYRGRIDVRVDAWLSDDPSNKLSVNKTHNIPINRVSIETMLRTTANAIKAEITKVAPTYISNIYDSDGNHWGFLGSMHGKIVADSFLTNAKSSNNLANDITFRATVDNYKAATYYEVGTQYMNFTLSYTPADGSAETVTKSVGNLYIRSQYTLHPVTRYASNDISVAPLSSFDYTIDETKHEVTLTKYKLNTVPNQTTTNTSRSLSIPVSYKINGINYRTIITGGNMSPNGPFFENIKSVVRRISMESVILRGDVSGLFQDMPSTVDDDIRAYTREVTNMQYMFANCIISRDENGRYDFNKWMKSEYFDTRNVTMMDGMFSGATIWVDSDSNPYMSFSRFNTEKVTGFMNMFSKVSPKHGGTIDVSLNLDLTSFNTSNAMMTMNMFAYSSKLASIKVSDQWTLSPSDCMGQGLAISDFTYV